MRTKIENCILLIVIVTIGLVLNYRYMEDKAMYNHAWAQSDRYALALGFINNDFNLFYPETYVLNRQFPAGGDQSPYNFAVPSDNGITSVDFPIHDYIAGAIMKITGNHSMSVFRWYTLLYGFIGLFFLFRLAKLLTGDFLKSLLAMVVLMTAPVFVFYQNSTLPSSPSLANAIIALYLYVLYWKKNKISHFHLSMLFFTLAVLNRTTFVIALIAVLSFEFLRIVRKESSFLPKLYSVLPSILLIVGYFLWNSYLRREYGSLFTNLIIPPKNWQEFRITIHDAYLQLRFAYFSKSQYLLFLVVIVAAIGVDIWRKCSPAKGESLGKKRLSLWLCVGIWFIGVALFCVFMFRQLPAHDYYFMDTFYLPIIFSFILLLRSLPNPNHSVVKIVALVGIVLWSIPMTTAVVKGQKERRVLTDFAPAYNYYEYDNINLLIEELNIPDTAIFLLPGAYPQNYPLCLMNRKGFPLMFMNRGYFGMTLDWDYDYIAIENSYFTYNFDDYSDIFSRFKKIGDNGKVSICLLSDTAVCENVRDFLAIDTKKTICQDYFRTGETCSGNWVYSLDSSDLESRIGLVSAEEQKGLGYIIESPDFIRQKPHVLFFSGQFLREGAADGTKVAVTVQHKNGKTIYHKNYNLASRFRKSENQWEEFSFLFTMPKIEQEDCLLFLQIIPEKKELFYFKDLEIVIYSIGEE